MLLLTNIKPHENKYRHYGIKREGEKVGIQKGRLGLSSGMLYTFASEGEAKVFEEMLINKKLRRGYEIRQPRQLPLTFP